MKKIFTFIAALTLSIGLFAEDATSVLQKHSLWQGTLPISWSSDGQIDISASGFEEVPAGAELVLCYTQVEQTWGQALLCFGDWSSFENLTNPDGTIITNNYGSLVPTDIYGWFEDGILYRETPIVLSDEVLAEMRAHVDDNGDILHIQGHDLIFNEIYVRWTNLSEVDMKPFITYEQPDPVFDYPYYPSWSDNTGKLRILRDNGLQDLNLEAGVSKIVFYKTAGTTGQIQINDPNWVTLETVADWYGGLTKLEYVLTDYAIKCINGDIVDGWGETAFILQGDGLEVTKITIVTETSPLPFDPQFVDAQSGLTFRVTDFGDVNNVKVISNNGEYPTYSGDIVIPSTVNYQDITFTVTRIGSGAFYGCSGLTSVTIPSSVTTIGEDAFYLVNNIVYNGTATGSPWGAKCVNGYVDGYLVYSDASKTKLCGCSTAAIGEITIPNSVTTIGNYAFNGCSGLTSVTIGNSVTKIGNSAFESCYGLTSVTIPNSVQTIGNYAFSSCSGLTSITIPNSVTTIGEQAFWNCTGLTSVTIPNSVTEIGENAFGNVNNIAYNGTATGSPWGAKCVNGYVDGYFVYSDATKTTLCGCSTAAIGEIIIPNSVTTIGDYAFNGCYGLTSVTIGNSVTTIGERAFYDCGGLTSVTIGNSVTTIGDYAFAWCSGLTSITIPNSVTTIGDYAFAWCSGLTSITIPNSVTTIGEGTFSNCYSLTSVNIPNSVTTIGDYAFSSCTGLTSITIPNSVTTIKRYAFAWNNALTSITIPKSVKTIGDWAFSGSKLKDVEVSWTNSDQLPTMGDYVFADIADWTGPWNATLHVPTGTKSIYETTYPWNEFGAIIEPQVGDVFEINGLWYQILTIGEPNMVKVVNHPDYANLQTISIPNSISCRGTRFDVIEVGDSAFKDCSELTLVVIPNSVTTIGESAFENCTHLANVTLGANLSEIGCNAFKGDFRLEEITIFAEYTPDVCSTTFDGVSKQYVYLYVPENSIRKYQVDPNWNEFDIQIKSADVTPMDGENPVVAPTDQDVTITWPITYGTDTYTLTITKNGEVVCVLTFNANGQLINIAFAAPGHNGAHQAPAATLTAQGYQFTVTGLDPGTAYNYSVTATDVRGKTLAEHKGYFSTTGGESDLQNVRNGAKTSKYFHNGNLIIERNGVRYTPAGQKVK